MPKLRILFTCLASFAFAAAALSQDSTPAPQGTAFVVSGIELDVRAERTEEARDAAFREAPRRAWPRLWARLTGEPADSAPEMSDAALSAIIDGIEVEEERFGGGRYIASLGVAFDRQRAGRRLPASARVLQSAPMLLVPLLVEGGASTTYDPESPWYTAWIDVAPEESVIDYVRPRGAAADRIMVNAWQAVRGDRELWREVLGRYQASNVLTAEARLIRSYPGGPVTGRFVARYGPDGEVLDRFTLRAGSTGELSAMMDRAVSRMDAVYARALERGELQADEAFQVAETSITAPPVEIDDGFVRAESIEADVPTPTAASWSAIERAAASVPGIERLTLARLEIGGTSSVRIRSSIELPQLRAALDRRGLRLVGGGGNFVLRQRRPDDPPLLSEAPDMGLLGSLPASPGPSPAPQQQPAGSPEPQPLLPDPSAPENGAGGGG